MVKEEKLIAGLRGGEDWAYREVLQHYGPLLMGYAKRLVGDRDEAEEVVQETVVAILQHIERFEGRCSIRSWLFRIVHHKAIDHLRRTARFVKPPEEDPYAEAFDRGGHWKETPAAWGHDPEGQAGARQMLHKIRAVIDQLPNNYKEMILLREIYQMDTQEICNVLGITSVHARVLLHRARQALYKLLEETYRGSIESMD
ncbi:sigma-70 family RNA polymerase sigma factor [Myxococcota bacterium]|nr:sigma-70 family RNA polymerase sigma factor [Myxococcota bacterium]